MDTPPVFARVPSFPDPMTLFRQQPIHPTLPPTPINNSQLKNTLRIVSIAVMAVLLAIAVMACLCFACKTACYKQKRWLLRLPHVHRRTITRVPVHCLCQQLMIDTSEIKTQRPYLVVNSDMKERLPTHHTEACARTASFRSTFSNASAPGYQDSVSLRSGILDLVIKDRRERRQKCTIGRYFSHTSLGEESLGGVHRAVLRPPRPSFCSKQRARSQMRRQTAGRHTTTTHQESRLPSCQQLSMDGNSTLSRSTSIKTTLQISTPVAPWWGRFDKADSTITIPSWAVQSNRSADDSASPGTCSISSSGTGSDFDMALCSGMFEPTLFPPTHLL